MNKALKFYNTFGRSKEIFEPIDADNIRIYACGPTVYDRIHVGNARPVVVFDVLVRLMRHHYKNVTYVRNITDIDDKINARAEAEGISIKELTEETTKYFHQDCLALGAEPPDIEPRATHHVDDMIAMIATLIEKGHAYEAEGHVLFDVTSTNNYGQLSRRSLDEMIAGARVEIAPYKRNPSDFVLWKPSNENQPRWESPWGYGRPGWHIECSAMSKRFLGESFDIHAGGLDLVFPHHENEIAQSCCASGRDKMASLWMHNGYVTVDGEKMSKSLGNFTTIADVLKRHKGEAIRYALLAAHYRAPLDFSINGVDEAKAALDTLYRAVATNDKPAGEKKVDEGVLEALGDDLNTPKALARLHELARQAHKGDGDAALSLKASARLLMGLLTEDSKNWLGMRQKGDDAAIDDLLLQRQKAKKDKDFEQADHIRDELIEQKIILEDHPDGTTTWRRK